MKTQSPRTDYVAPLRSLPRINENTTAYLLLSPAFAVVGLFGLFPLLYSLYISLFEWRLRRGPFVGLGNYVDLFGSIENFALVVMLVTGLLVAYHLAAARISRSFRWTGRALLTVLGIALFLALSRVWQDGDTDMVRSFQVTVWFVLGTVPVQMVFGLLVALALNSNFRGRQGFRVLFLLPYIVPIVASAGVFDVLFSLSPDSMANQILHALGIQPSQWLRESKGIVPLLRGSAFPVSADALGSWAGSWISGPSLALICILIFNNWLYTGYYALIFANGLAAIPREVYEAATLDGAKKSTLLFRIVVPLLSPTSSFLVLFGIIGTFKAFNSVYVLRDAATGGATDPTSVYIFFTFFREQRYGYAAAQALIFFGIVLGITLILRKIMEKRVFYD